MNGKLFLFSLFFLSVTLLGQSKIVLKNGGWLGINGTYQQEYANAYEVKYRGGDQNLYIVFGENWSFDGEVNWYWEVKDVFGTRYLSGNSSTASPIGMVLTNIGTYKVPPIITGGQSLVYSGKLFSESISDNGTIGNSIVITYENSEGATFTGSTGESFIDNGKVVVTNVPHGLSVWATKTDSVHVTLGLSGSAYAHAPNDSISNLTVVFTNAAFSGNDAAGVENNSVNNITLSYIFSTASGSSMLSNCSGSKGYSYWTKTDGGNGWVIASGGRNGGVCWKSSYQNCTLTQTVDLVNAGFSTAMLDASPVINAGVWVLPGFYTGNAYASKGIISISVTLINSSDQEISTQYISNNENLGSAITSDWFLRASAISGYGSGLRKVKLTLTAKDGVGWAGQYGPAFDDAFLNIGGVLPVELTAFSAYAEGSAIALNWKTATEVQNYGFEIEHSTDKQSWKTIGFVKGAGNCNTPREYSFRYELHAADVMYFRLKQIDFTGSFSYSKTIQVNALKPEIFSVYPNYPNPFNPGTTIRFSLPDPSYVTIRIYTISGEEVQVLPEGLLSAGLHELYWNAKLLPTGTYLINIKTAFGQKIQKVLLLK